MKPERARVRNYKSIDDTGWVEIDDLTCLIGKNESGKTVLMEALTRLNPAQGESSFTPYEDYPRRRWSEYKDRHDDNPDPVVSVEFALDREERSLLDEHGGRAPNGTVVVTKDYANDRHWDIEVDESTAAAADQIGEEVLAPELPAFQYVGEYSSLDASIDLDAFAERVETGERTASDRVFESLLSVADLSVDSLRQEDWRETLTDLEAASSEVTSAVTDYWSQADDVVVRLRGVDGESRTVEVRVENPHHGVTVEFDQRSQGFRWFFSTFCTLFALRDADEEVVLLLDEPGLHLHPKAKREFLSFLDEEIAADGTVMYSTHSPFMIDLDRAHRTKMIHKDPETGSTVLSDPDDADAYTRFPLQNVFELGVMETMVSRSQLLLVEDGTTYEYLYNVSDLLEDTDAPVLDRGWTVLPIGTLENTATVRSVFDTGEREVAIVHDGTELGGSPPPGDVTVVGIGSHALVDGDATIEDVLSESFYLELVNRTYAGEFSAASGAPDRVTSAGLADVASTGPIVDRLDRYFAEHGIADGSFERSRPATYLQRHRGEFADEVDMDTRKAFGSLARELNRTLGHFDGDRKTGFFESLFGG
ncbi:energy-coupling factor transporter ATP-binding protein EcfA2 [Halorubrum alkaliphilum]|uniref:Energy-coupling factor transporter ATP-binding protein EcfA2 n=1 Tax=Halorubrum alkaliphilum TaxID=261290 RepID=A0A8T4GBE2_9EURY|nr:AAA family ATPase [Halorubrum alkaliphilum]MBP1921049.1 energy-coupling factor transporter ATP-binding protein EcfA2 [Halorubrum alkaliphilum]